MCGRFYLDESIDALMNRYKITTLTDEYESKGEIYPTDLAPVIVGSNNRKIKMMKWGFMLPFMKKAIINARSETIDTKPMFRYSFYNSRCIIPANAFFEWEKIQDKKLKRNISTINQNIFSMAGLYSAFKDKEGTEYFAFTILTTEADKQIKPIHDRMPVILSEKTEAMWIDMDIKNPSTLKDILKPYQRGLKIS